MSSVTIFWQQRLGAGGEGEVFKGKWQGLDVAVKVPRNHHAIAYDPRARAAACQGLREEILRRSHVRGDHHVRVLHDGLDHPVPCLVLELATGSLADEMDAVKRVGRAYSPLEALGRIEEILCALREIHSANIIHRDIKPANFLKFPDGRIKLNDFGLGRTADRACSQQTQAFKGTPMYAAPEQVFGGCVTGQSDLWSVGAILHEMLYGVVPDKFRHPVGFPHRVDVRDELRAFLGSLLAHDPQKRFSSATQALNSLAQVRLAYSTQEHRCPRCGRVHGRRQ